MEGKTWITIVTIAAPVISAIVVAVISQQTNLHLAEIESAAKTASIEIEQRKLGELQDARRQQFMENHLPKLLSTNDVERRLGRALVFVTPPNQAGDLLELAMPAATTEEARASLQEEAKTVASATGDWVIVIGGDKSLNLAKGWVTNAIRLGFTPASIYLRDNVYRVTVGSYPTRYLAEQAAVAVRPKTRPDAYVVALGRWCPSQIRKDGESEIVECTK